MFDQESLKKQVETVLAPIPTAHKHAIVGFANTQGDVKLTYAHRMDEHGEFGIVVARDRLHGFNAGVFVAASW